MVVETKTCIHAWAIEAAHRTDHGGIHPTSAGRCKFCGEVREHHNYIEGRRFGYQRLKPRGESGGNFDPGR
jgi:N-methylhydantoinase B/oxoprolinase/acetone carboxylase alpha subunit